MKIRSDFVTNSSSSSFVCDFCGAQESGYDMSLSEAGMYECENGHTFCSDHMVKDIEWLEVVKKLISNDVIYNKESIEKYPESTEYYTKRMEEAKELLLELSEKDEDELEELADEYEFRYSVPEEYCPLCSFVNVTDNDMRSYLLAKHHESHDEALKEIREKFDNYSDFKEFCGGK
jgi:hypothetical protein